MSLSQTFKSSLVRSIRPDELFRIFRLQKNRKKTLPARVRHDPQLELYSRILKRDFLHYGYFLDPKVPPESISLKDIEDAQLEYARLFLKQMTPGDQRPVLDAGCGMGGLSVLLRDEGYHPTALTPDEHQIRYIREKHGTIPTLHCKLEELDSSQYRGHFGTVITSESLQYLQLDQALPILNEILAPGGRWMICDYFRKEAQATEKSGHVWSNFVDRIRTAGWEVELDQDITSHILVTLRYAWMLGERILIPLTDFGIEKVRVKQPGIAHLLRDFLPQLSQKVHDSLKVIDPERFAQEKTYRFVVLKRSA